MSLAQILYPPPTSAGMEEWFHAHLRHHEALIGAIKESQGITLQLFQIYPVDMTDLKTWGRQHQAQHDNLNAVLKIPSTDLSTIDFKDQTTTDGWFFEHFLQHQAAGQLCGLPI